MGSLGWSEPKRVRTSVHHAGRHLGYATTISYPNRDITALTEGTPYSEVVVADLRERHVALLQRFQKHWLIYCGERYHITDRAGPLTDDQVQQLARFALRQRATGSALAELLKEQLDAMLPESVRPARPG